MIIVIDYGSGNLRSVAKALETTGATVRITGQPQDLAHASHLVLPGVGAFADCRRNLETADLIPPILDHVRAGKPFLGICVGMQLLFSEGHEFGIHPGLDLIRGQVVRFSNRMPDPNQTGSALKVPHMGWNRLRLTGSHPLWNRIADGTHGYFVHSYHVQADDPHTVAAWSDHGIAFPAAIAKENLFGTQFHPEKSQEAGLQLLRNFVEWRP
ncbi:MAG: imidazole glycerol phosphate synthase subunit HisH [Magnetococcales bacterium]|nr:imidazole glycerol phosphate synthase subunit HisH [Magnetococcales bacterium]NGZ06693.1 imidazole glycerol phosphate synthase subunit HisH [Magnetococcales bacterium]